MYNKFGIGIQRKIDKSNGYPSLLKIFLSREIIQNETLSHSIVNKILYSRRLLVDHVESLEASLPTISDKPPDAEIFTFVNTSLLISCTLLQKLVTPERIKFSVIPVSIGATAFCGWYLVKKVFDIRKSWIDNEIDLLINCFEKFGNCIKRNITYFNEILVMKNHELTESRQCERAWDCITTVKEVIDILYDATKKLEDEYILPPRFREHYYSMEDLKESKYYKNNVTDYSPSNIKDFYNIFAYVQSQFLFRLALNVSQEACVKFLQYDINQIRNLIEQHINEEEERFQYLTYEMKRKQITSFHYPIKSKPIEVLKESSLKLSAKMTVMADKCFMLDAALLELSPKNFDDLPKEIFKEDKESFMEISNKMHVIENSLTECFEDFQHMMLIYNKFLGSHIKEPESTIPIESEDLTESDAGYGIFHLQEMEKKDDFYAYVDEKDFTSQEDNNNQMFDFELIKDEKIIKNKFKPVLKQLRSKIDPIRKEMFEKERKVLESKGVNLEKLLEFETKDTELLASKIDYDKIENSSEDSADEKSPKLLRIDPYSEMRNFLAQKSAVSLFSGVRLDNDVSNTLTEDILE